MMTLSDVRQRRLAGRVTVALEIRDGERFRHVASVHLERAEEGIASPSRLEYDLDYLAARSGDLESRGARAVSCLFPLGYGDYLGPRFPPFLLDIMPSGAARRTWEARLDLPGTEGAANDVALLVAGGGHPPGNVRVKGAHGTEEAEAHAGFPRSDVLARAADFIEYAHSAGAPVSGSSGAGGDAPKFLLREDIKSRFHADGALADAKTRALWLVKFPRTREKSDRLVLEAEAAYHRVARRFGVRTHGALIWERDCLFCPRFDREVSKRGVEYLGMESLCSLAGVAEFGRPIAKEILIARVAAVVDDPVADVKELVLRDVLDVALGNTDNHARNTSIVKTEAGAIRLAPLYDFAPMILDPRGIARVCRWADGSDYPDWRKVAEALVPFGLPLAATRSWLGALSAKVASLPAMLREEGTPEEVVSLCKDRIRNVAKALAKAAP